MEVEVQLSMEKNKYSRRGENFKNFYLRVKEKTVIIPNLNILEHGDSFCNNEYNGYDLSYLCIKYLNDILNPDEFRKLMSDFSKIKEYGNDLINKMFDYYDNNLKNEMKK